MLPTLQNLCAQFCAIVQAPAPDPLEQHDGTVAFNIAWRNVTVDLMARPLIDPAHAFILFHMGTPDPAHSDFARILQALLKTNFVNLHANQPVLSCHPETAAVLLQWAIPLTSATGEDLHRMIDDGVNLVLQWRQSHFLAPAGVAPRDTAHSFA